MKRKSGYYWVRRDHASSWVIAEWNERNGLWYLHGTEYSFNDSYFKVVDETIMDVPKHLL